MTLPSYFVRRIQQKFTETCAWPDWSLTEALSFRKIRHEPEDYLPLREATAVAALWDERRLYLAFTIQDSEVWATLTIHDARLFTEECVEIFIDPDGDGERYIELQVNSLGTVRDLLVDGTIAHPSPADYDRMAQWHFRELWSEISEIQEQGRTAGWRLQIAMPWGELDFSRRRWPPEPGDELRINFYRYERSRNGAAPLELSGWSQVEDSFHQPARFGRFIFQGASGG